MASAPTQFHGLRRRPTPPGPLVHEVAQGIELPANAFDNGTVRHGTDNNIEIKLRNFKLFILFLRHS